MFKGGIANEPGLVGIVQMGESWSIGREENSDWMFTQRRMIHGGFTITALLDSMPEIYAEPLTDVCRCLEPKVSFERALQSLLKGY